MAHNCGHAPLGWPQLCGCTKMKLKITGVAVFVIFLFLALVGLGNDETPVESEPYTVQKGDTLWQLSQERWEGDVREGVWWIRNENDLESPIIHPGQTIIIPKKKEETD